MRHGIKLWKMVLLKVVVVGIMNTVGMSVTVVNVNVCVMGGLDK
jgi:hypothetical protein